jgi:hypothetical protein
MFIARYIQKGDKSALTLHATLKMEPVIFPEKP